MALPAERAYADSTASKIDREVHDIAQRAFDRAVAVLTERRALLDTTARKLLAQETLEAEDITAIAVEMQVPA
jgi:cell division protease FtsH